MPNDEPILCSLNAAYSREPTMPKSPKNFWSGVIYIAFGSAVLIVGQDYSMGSALRMGPAYFPTVIAGLLLVVGTIAVGRGLAIRGPVLGPLGWPKVLLIVGSVLIFGLTVRGLGLVVTVPLLILISARASKCFGWASSIALAAGLTALCVLVFLRGLGVPLPLLGTWIAD